MTVARIRMHLLGRFELQIGEQIIIDQSWGRRKAKALLKLLALQHRRSLHREQVLDRLWPEMEPKAAANNLHKSLHVLRTALAAQDISTPLITLKRDLLALSPEIGIDVDQFRTQVQRARIARHDVALWGQALDLYGGDLLPEDIYEDWTVAPREQLRELHHQLLMEVSALHEARGRTDLAIERLHQLLYLDPIHEGAHRSLMRLYCMGGTRHRALQQYHDCRAVLSKELGVEPSEATEALYQEILDGRIPSQAPIAAPLVPTNDRDAPVRHRPIEGGRPELDAARTLLDAALQSQGKSLFIVGEAGIGKTHLATQILQAARQAGALTVASRYDELDLSRTYQPLRDALRQLEEQAGVEVMSQALCGSPQLRRLLPQANRDAPPGPDAQMEVLEEAGRLFGRLATEHAPLVLGFDDLHAADASSLRLVYLLCRQLQDQPIFLIATYRPDRTAGSPLAQLLREARRAHLIRDLALGPLPEPLMHPIIRQAFGGAVDQDLLDEITRRAEGNPRFARDLVETLMDRGGVSFGQGRWQLRAPEGVCIPATVHDLLDSCAQNLTDTAIHVLQIASAVGHPIDYGLLRNTLQATERAILDALDTCIAAFILEETQDGFRFRHSLIRDAVYHRMTRARRQQVHRAVATALGGAGTVQADSEPGIVTFHFAQSEGAGTNCQS